MPKIYRNSVGPASLVVSFREFLEQLADVEYRARRMRSSLRMRKIHMLILLTCACAPDDAREAPPLPRPEEGVAAQSSGNAGFESSARSVLAFLRGSGPFPETAIADSVTLYVSPEAGGGSMTYGREQLRDRAAWRVPVNGHQAAVAPAAELTHATMRLGTHFRCFEQALATRFPRLASYPHVGVKLEPDGGDSCLQTWNATMVFDSLGARPLIALVYDQWEW